MKYYKSIKLLEGVLIEGNNHTNLININFGKYFELDFDSNLEINLKKGFSKYLSSKYQDFNKSILDKNYYEIEKKNEIILNKRVFNLKKVKIEKIEELLQEFNNSLGKTDRLKDLSKIEIEKFRKVFSFEKFFADFGILFIDNGEEKTFNEINKILKKNKIGNLSELNTIEKLINNGGKDLKIKEKFEVEIQFHKLEKNYDYKIIDEINDITSLFFFEKSYYSVYNIKK